MIPDPLIPSHPKPIFLTKALLVDSSEISLGLDHHPLDHLRSRFDHHQSPSLCFVQGADLSIPQLSQMAGRALQPILPPLRRLQAMACGDSEKYAPQLLQKLQEAPEAGSVLDELKAGSWGTHWSS